MASRIGSFLSSSSATRLRSLNPLSSLLPFSTSSSSSPPTSRLTNPTSSFDWSDSEPEPEPEPDSSEPNPPPPPPHNPFDSKPVVPDPTNLQEVFHAMRREGLAGHAIKMFDGLSRDGRTHEALELFAVIREKGVMPDVVAHTAVVEAYLDAGGTHWRSAVRCYERMLAHGVMPNAYTFAVLIKGLAKLGRFAEAGKYLVEMVTRGMKPNVGTYLSVFEAYVTAEKFEEGKELLEELKEKGFEPDEKSVRDGTVKRGYVFEHIMRLLFDK